MFLLTPQGGSCQSLYVDNTNKLLVAAMLVGWLCFAFRARMMSAIALV